MTCISSSIRSILVVESRPDVSAPCRQSVDAEIPASLGLPSDWVDSPLMCTRGCDVCNRGRNAEYPSLRTCVSGYRGKIEREQRKDRRKNETATATLSTSQASCRMYSRGGPKSQRRRQRRLRRARRTPREWASRQPGRSSCRRRATRPPWAQEARRRQPGLVKSSWSWR